MTSDGDWASRAGLVKLLAVLSPGDHLTLEKARLAESAEQGGYDFEPA